MEIMSGEHRGAGGVLTALDTDGDAFVKLSHGGRAVVSVDALQLCGDVGAGAPATVVATAAVTEPVSNDAASLAAAAAEAIAVLPPEPPTGTKVTPPSGTDKRVTVGEPCLEALRAWPGGAHAAAIGLLEEPGDATVELARALLRAKPFAE